MYRNNADRCEAVRPTAAVSSSSVQFDDGLPLLGMVIPHYYCTLPIYHEGDHKAYSDFGDGAICSDGHLFSQWPNDSFDATLDREVRRSTDPALVAARADEDREVEQWLEENCRCQKQ